MEIKDYINLAERFNKPVAICEFVFSPNNVATDYKFLFANKQFCSLCAMSQEDLADTPITTIFNVDVAPWLEHIVKITDGNTAPPFETYFEPLKKHLLINCVAIDNCQFLLEIENITEKVNTIVTLKVLNQEYESHYENAPDMFLSVSMDNGKIIRCNRMFSEKFGVEKKCVTGKLFSDFIAKESVKDYYSLLIDILANKIIENRELTLKTASGKTIIASLNAIAENIDPKTKNCRLSLRDITSFKEMEEALGKAEQRFGSFVDLVDGMIYFLSLKGEMSHLNNAVATISGYSCEEFSRDPLFYRKIINPDDVIISQKFFDTYPNGAPFFDMEYRLKTKDGTWKYIYSKMIGVKDNDNNYTGYYCIDLDVSYLKDIQNDLNIAREKAEEANRLKTIILNNLGHELRTPLNGILGFAQILLDELKSEDFLEMAGYIWESGVRLERILNSLLALSELETHKKNAYIEKINISDFIKSYCPNFENNFTRKGLLFKYETEDDNLTVQMDENLTMQILFNLLDNSLKYTTKGSVTVSAKRHKHNKKNYVALSVSDTGPGISQKNIKSVFEAFRQESEGISRLHEGIGIGLTLTQKMAELQNAGLVVESEVNKGTTFTVLFPA